MIEKQSYNFIRIGGCNSCHSQDLASVAAAFARSRGLAAPQIPQLPQSMMPPPERLIDFGFVAVSGIGWELFDFGMNGVAKNAYTDAAVRVIKAMQTPQGNWSANESRRPPMNAGDFNATALAIYAIKHYTPAGNEATSDLAIKRAVAWLEHAHPKTTQDRVVPRAGSVVGERGVGGRAALCPRAHRNCNGSMAAGARCSAWSPTLTPPGQALFALHVAGRLPASDPVYQKGIDYLLRTQAADGTWHVKSRSIWLQPYFESGFPYGQDQFISTAGTAWAAMALAAAAPAPAATTSRAGGRDFRLR